MTIPEENSLNENEYKVRTLYNLYYIINDGIIMDKDFLVDEQFEFPLSEYGKKAFDYLKGNHEDFNESTLFLALFMDFYFSDFYFEKESIDVELIFQKFSSWIQKGYIRYPFIYGRHLYNKYYEDFEKQEHILNYTKTYKLLENSQKGVFQVGNIIVGPFGLLESKVERELHTRLKLGLWHCSDPSCDSFHMTNLKNMQNHDINKAYDSLKKFNKELPLIDIDQYLLDDPLSIFYNPYSLKGLSELIGGAFVLKEQRKILQRIIDVEKIRDLLPDSLKKGKSKKIVGELNEAECLSLILLVEDNIIVKHIEELIDENSIKIPITEVRESKIIKGYDHYDTFLQCNKLGIRVNSANQNLSVVKLKKLLKDVYNESPLREQLEWKLRKYPNELNFNQKLSKYIIDTNPLTIIQDNILSGSDQLRKTFESLPGVFKIPNSSEEKRIAQKIAWKIEFDINLYPMQLSYFWKNLSLFKSSVLNSLDYDEDDKANIRREAVNLFVSMEGVLQESLSFITMALLSDHYSDTKFQYIYENARDFMISKLNNFEYTKDAFLEFDISGKNTLFPLVEGFSALVKICDKISEEEKNHLRSQNNFPSFYQNDPLKFFPFEHKIFLLDIAFSDYQKIRKILEIIHSEFGKGNIINIRNRLQHKRDDFPVQDEILKAINSIEKCFSILENEGIYPDVFLFKKAETDLYDRTLVSLVNYKGKEITIFKNKELNGSYIPPLSLPVVIIPSIKLGLTNHPVTFLYKEQSDYQSHWKNFPRKKTSDIED